MMTGKTIVVLGGGVGGLVAAHKLRRSLNKRQHRVVLVDQSPLHTFAPSFPWVMVGKRDPRRVVRDLRPLARKGIDFVLGEVVALDPANKKVRLAEEELSYDYLVLALGAEYTSHEVPGLGKAWSFYHLEGAQGLAEELPKFQGGRVAVAVSALPYKCPAAPYEGTLLLDRYDRGIRENVELHVYTPEAAPLPVAGVPAAQMALELLAGRDIAFTGGAKLKKVDHEAKALTFEDGSEAAFDMLIATPVHHPPQVVTSSGLGGESGWMPVDRETLATEFEGVYAVGDMTTIPLANGLPLPKAGVFAHGQAEVVARNIAAEIDGSPPQWSFGGHGSCFLEIGGGKAAFVTGDFYAEPNPEVALRGPGRIWHWQKAGFERLWLWRWF
jgi:sulfide:quinone oxidoreductase